MQKLSKTYTEQINLFLKNIYLSFFMELKLVF
jgi:hypothetical protein